MNRLGLMTKSKLKSELIRSIILEYQNGELIGLMACAYSHDVDHSFSPKPISHSHSCRSLLLVTLR